MTWLLPAMQSSARIRRPLIFDDPKLTSLANQERYAVEIVSGQRNGSLIGGARNRSFCGCGAATW